VDAGLALDELNERLGLHLPTNGDFQTVGGFVFSTLGRLPSVGDTLHHGEADFTILEVGDHSIRRLRLDLHPSEVAGRSSSVL
jgi:CBS domain containing-hemolysin-like protein